MVDVIRKLNLWHILILISLPIILALINSNWVFNNFIIDDYIYLGYQMDLPNYLNWEPSASHYFIDRISWFLPTYAIHQILPHLLANFVIHFSVYYLAIFSVYGIMNRLFQARVALFTCILMGQFALFMRAVGWDYVDGYSLALLTFCTVLLTYVATSSNSRRYLLGAGAIASIMIVAQIFNVFYCPALALYYFWLNHRHKKHPFIHTVLYTTLGTMTLFGIQTWIYHAITGRWFIFQNTFEVSRGGQMISVWSQQLSSNYSDSVVTWHIFYILITITALWAIASPKRFMRVYGENTTHFRHHLQAVFILLFSTYGVLWLWLLIFHNQLLRLSYYSSIVIPSLFMTFGALVAGELYRLTNTQFKTTISLALIIPISFFIGFNFLSVIQLMLLLIIAIILGLIFFIIGFKMKHPKRLMSLVASFTLLNFVSGIDSHYIGVFNTNRFANQQIYEIVTEATTIINNRFDNYGTDVFRFWYDNHDTNKRAIFSLTSIYGHNWTRRIRAINDNRDSTPENLRWDENLYTTQEIIMLSTEQSAQEILAMGNRILNPLGYELVMIEEIRVTKWGLSLQLVFTHLKALG